MSSSTSWTSASNPRYTRSTSSTDRRTRVSALRVAPLMPLMRPQALSSSSAFVAPPSQTQLRAASQRTTPIGAPRLPGAAYGVHAPPPQLPSPHAPATSTPVAVTSANSLHIRVRRTTLQDPRAAHEVALVERLGMTLERLNRRVEGQLASATRESGPDSGALLQRASDLNRRLAVLKDKLRVATTYYDDMNDEVRRSRALLAEHTTASTSASAPSSLELLHGARSGAAAAVPVHYFHQQQHRYQANASASAESWQIVLRQIEEADPDDAPRDFVCPISQCVMIDPVRTADGHCYDRASIAEWFMTFDDGKMPTSPLTNLPLVSLELTPANELRAQILAYLREARSAKAGMQQEQQGVAGTSRPAAAAADEPSVRDAPPPPPHHRDDRVLASSLSLSSHAGAGGGYGCDLLSRPAPSSLPVSSSWSRHATSANVAMTSDTLSASVGQLLHQHHHHHHQQLSQTQPVVPGQEALTSATMALNRSLSATTTNAAACASVAATHAAGSSGPIWSSSVVPSREPHARALNLLRLDDTIELPPDVATMMGGLGTKHDHHHHKFTFAAPRPAPLAPSMSRIALLMQPPAPPPRVAATQQPPDATRRSTAGAATVVPRNLNQRRA